MPTLSELKKGNEFYFEDNRASLFVFKGFIYRKDGSIKTAVCNAPGKLHPIYISAKQQPIIILQTPVINIFHEETNK